MVVVGALALASVLGIGVMAAEPAAAAIPGVVAVHNGGWGYQELVYSKAATRQLADQRATDIIAVLTGLTGYGVPVALQAYLVKAKAQDAVGRGECFALVRPVGGSPYFPATERWGCR